MKVAFQGGSDDLVEIEGFGREYGGFDIDEFGVVTPFSCELHAADGSSAVLVILDLRGEGWSAALARTDEGVPVLPMGVEFGDGDRPYNVRLTLDIPEGARLRYLRDETGDLADVE